MTVSNNLIKDKISKIISSKTTNDEKIKAFEIFIEEVKIGYYMKAHNEISREKANKRREQEILIIDAKNKGKVFKLEFK